LISDKSLLDLKKYDGDDRVIDSFEMRKHLAALPKQKRIKSNIVTLDKHCEDFEAGEVIVVSGPRKSGKTLFCQTLTCEFNNQDVIPIWFSYEVSPRNFFAVFKHDGLPYFTLPMILRANALNWIELKIAESIAKFGTGVVFLDHLHYLVDLERMKNSSIEIGTIMRNLKWLANEHNVIIFLMCHMTKGIKGKEPGDGDVRDSGFISQESDTGLVLWRTKEQNVSWLKICYTRRSGVFNEKVKLMKINGLLKEVNENYENPVDENSRTGEQVRTDPFRGG